MLFVLLQFPPELGYLATRQVPRQYYWLDLYCLHSAAIVHLRIHQHCALVAGVSIATAAGAAPFRHFAIRNIFFTATFTGTL